MSPLPYFAPAFILFELAQLVLSERLVGVRQIRLGVDPRDAGPSERIAAAWTLLLLLYWTWILLLLFEPGIRAQALSLATVTALGFALRRTCSLKWLLVIMTFEGAVRIGMLISLCGVLWRLG